MANSHRRRNSISSIRINGRNLVKKAEVKEGLVRAFQCLLSAPINWRLPLPDLDVNLIGEDHCAKLEEMFTEEEILAAISGLNDDKAPGSIWFSFSFLVFQLGFRERGGYGLL